MADKFGEWIDINDYPEEEDVYLVAWLPADMKRSECFIELAYYHGGEWEENDLQELKKRCGSEVKLYAWMPLPEMYKP